MLDRQKKKVYAWEDTWEYSKLRGLSEAGLRHWVRWACKLYGVAPPTVRLHRRVTGGTSFYCPEDHSIEFRKRHANVWTALHEAAHAIETKLFGEDNEAHGPLWLGIFLALLVKAGYAPAQALYGSIKKLGLRYAVPGKIGPRRVRKHYAAARSKKRHY